MPVQDLKMSNSTLASRLRWSGVVTFKVMWRTWNGEDCKVMLACKVPTNGKKFSVATFSLRRSCHNCLLNTHIICLPVHLQFVH